MSEAAVLAWLLRASLMLLVATAAVMAMRRGLARAFGARAAYAMWIIVPMALVGTAVPLPTPIVPAIAASTLTSAIANDVSAAAATWQPGWLLAWLAGMALSLARLRVANARVRHAGEPLTVLERARLGGSFAQSTPAGLTVAWHDLGPAITGLLRPQLLVPRDFSSRFSSAEQAQILDHELTHVAHGDLWWNALAHGLKALFWFHPAIHFVYSHFRFDQEAACDAAVLARQRHRGADYARTLLKAQGLQSSTDFVVTAWTSHPRIKERISMIQLGLPSVTRRRSGLVVTAAFGFLSIAAGAAVSAEVRPASEDLGERMLGAPAYPPEALARHQNGHVEVEVVVGADGRVQGMSVVRAEPPGVFEETTKTAVAKWRFKPALAGGKPVESRVRVPIDFSIHEDDADKAPSSR